MNARRSHVTLRDGGEESRLTSTVKQGSGAQQRGDPGPSPRRIVTTQSARARAPGAPEPSAQVLSALHQPPGPVPSLLPTTGPRRVTCPWQVGCWHQAPQSTSRICTPATKQAAGGGSGTHVSRTQLQSSAARPEPGGCCSVSSIYPQTVTMWPSHVRSSSELMTFLPQGMTWHLPDVLPGQGSPQ